MKTMDLRVLNEIKLDLTKNGLNMCDFPFSWVFLEKLILLSDSLDDSENDLKINVFFTAVESAVDVDADVRFKDSALVNVNAFEF